MAQDAWPFATRLANETEWRKMGRLWRPSGVLRGELNALAVQQRAAGAAMQVDVQTGNAWIAGHYYENGAVVELPVVAPVANPRIDTVVVRLDFALGTRAVVVVQGAEAAAPAPPALTQDLTTKWEEPLADLWCPVGMVSVKTADDAANGYLLTDRRRYLFPEFELASSDKEPVRLATIAAMAASTLTGTRRVANANGAMATIDGVAPAVGDRILDKDHATTTTRGIWIVESLGSATRPWRMRRAVDADTSAKVRAGLYVRVTEGGTLADTGWLLTTNDPIVLDTTALTFTQFPAAAAGGGSAFSGARVRHSVDQNAATATHQILAFDTESIDRTTFHDNVTNNSRLTIPSTGYYEVSCSVQYLEAAAAGIQRKVELALNGANMKDWMAKKGAVGDYVGIHASMILSLTAGDYLELKMYQDSGSTVAVQGAGSLTNDPYFGIKYLGS